MQLDDTWGDLLQQYQMMLYESIGYYGNAIKELEDLGGGYVLLYVALLECPSPPPPTHTQIHIPRA